MSPARRKILGAAATVLFLVSAGLAGFYRSVSRRPEPATPEVVPASWSEFRMSAGHQLHVGKSTVTCKDCHRYEATGFASPGADVCSRCHQEQTAHTHAGGERKTDCFACHSFRPGETPSCVGCHAQAQGSHAAVAQHATVACNDCHHPHATSPITPKACTSCHDQRALAHAAHPASKDCQDCHRAHEPARAALESCSTCHHKPSGPKPANHDSCLTCHKPHDFVAQGARVCVGCHGAKPTLVANTAPAHARCTSCHTPHAPARAASSCQGCHAQVHVAHAGKEDCIGCHAPHKSDIVAVATAPTAAPNANACTSCHTSVAATDLGAHAAGAACTSCHKAHSFVKSFAPLARGQLCSECHAAQTTLAADNRGHRECLSCHGSSAHRPTKAPACGTCHGSEVASAPTGHQKCGSCHESHGGGRVPEAATCTGCHAKKASELHATLQGGCDNCHRPHGPKGVAAPPACASCHENRTLPALHALASHSDCAKCHTSHRPPRSDRETCTGSCHVNRRDHQPAAKVCSGCHVFRN